MAQDDYLSLDNCSVCCRLCIFRLLSVTSLHYDWTSMSLTALREKLKTTITTRDWVDNIEEEDGWTPLICSECTLPFHGWKLKTKCMICAVPNFPIHCRHITHTAVRFEGRVHSLPAPHRHHHVLRLIYRECGRKAIGKEGFLDNCGKFLSREEALHIARAAGQILDLKLVRGVKLYSENLW